MTEDRQSAKNAIRASAEEDADPRVDLAVLRISLLVVFLGGTLWVLLRAWN